MKRKLAFIIALFLPTISFATVNGVTQNFESGNRTIERGYCWQFDGATISSTNRISGNYSGYTSSLNNQNDPRYFVSPWIQYSGNDQAHFKFKITSLNGATNHYFRVTLISMGGVRTTLLDYTFANTQIQEQTLPISVSGTYQLEFLFTGTGGGSARGILDDIDITGSYMADPTNNPNGSGACAVLVLDPDSDGDGVTDSEDAYPDDPLKAFNLLIPAQGFGSLAFEDMWPEMGDYDFNDLVVKYRVNQISNSSNQVVEIQATFIPQALGAGYKNGLGFMLPVPAASIASVSGSYITENFIVQAANGLEANQQNAVVIVFDNGQTAFSNVTGSNPPGMAGINSCIGGRSGTGMEININIQFSQPVTASNLGVAPYNPFLIVNAQREVEVHLPDMPPTGLANTALFGTAKDNSNPAQGRFYKSLNNLPWAMNIVEPFEYPIEKAQISEGHLKFIDWAESGGSNFPGWYKNLNGYRNASKVFY